MRADALFIGMGISALTEQAGNLRKFWPALSLGQAVYWVCVASILERLAMGRFSGLGLVFVALLFGFVVAGRLSAGAAECWPARALRKSGELSFSAYLVHLPVLSGMHDALADKITPTLSLVASLAAIVVATMVWETLVVKPSAELGRRLSEKLTLKNCKSEAEGCNFCRQFIRKRRTG
jgi:peptidoglycan/LPS O-acetylase OafA/YrhL